MKRTKTVKLHPESMNPKGEDRPEPIRAATGEGEAAQLPVTHGEAYTRIFSERISLSSMTQGNPSTPNASDVRPGRLR